MKRGLIYTHPFFNFKEILYTYNTVIACMYIIRIHVNRSFNILKLDNKRYKGQTVI